MGLGQGMSWAIMGIGPVSGVILGGPASGGVMGCIDAYGKVVS